MVENGLRPICVLRPLAGIVTDVEQFHGGRIGDLAGPLYLALLRCMPEPIKTVTICVFKLKNILTFFRKKS